ERTPLELRGDGTLTGLPSIGDVIASGQAIAEVDGEPVVALAGQRPMWRPMQRGMKDGADVAQLESALVALGYATADGLVVDEEWTSSTTAAVKAFQESAGLPVDGRLAMGEIVFVPESVRVASVGGALGGPASGAGIEVSGIDQAVTVTIGTDDL